MADFNVDFDTPKTSSRTDVQISNFTVPGDNTQGYVRIKLTVTNTAASPRGDIYYRTISIPPTGTAYSFHGTYNIAVVPKALLTDSITPTYAISFTAQV